MKVVFKYELPMKPLFELVLPDGAEILTFKEQNKEFYIWCLVDTGRKTGIRHFEMSGTGEPITKEIIRYIGTIVTDNDERVFHLFEVSSCDEW